jgi:hypothetical protein
MIITWYGWRFSSDIRPSPGELARAWIKHALKVERDYDGSETRRHLLKIEVEALESFTGELEQWEAETDDWVAFARSGDQEALEFCADLMVAFSDQGLRIPPNLARVCREAILGDLKLVRRKGRPKNGRKHRVLAPAILLLLEIFPDLRPTRNSATCSTPSACSIAAEAYSLLAGERCSEKTAERIYNWSIGPARWMTKPTVLEN